jgi:hypothetical protein
VNRHKHIRVVIDVVLSEPISLNDILPHVSRSLAAYPIGHASCSALPLDPPVRPEQEGFSSTLFGTTHLTRGQS